MKRGFFAIPRMTTPKQKCIATATFYVKVENKGYQEKNTNWH